MKRLLFVLMFIASLNAFLTSCERRPKENISAEFDVNFIVDEEVVFSTTVEDKSEIALMEDPEKVGYIFEGWFFDSDWQELFRLESVDDFINEDRLDLYAKFEIKTYTVTFNLNEGDLISGETEQIVEHGNSAVAPEIEREDHILIGWDKDFINIIEDTVVSAVWELEVIEGLENLWAKNSHWLFEIFGFSEEFREFDEEDIAITQGYNYPIGEGEFITFGDESLVVLGIIPLAVSFSDEADIQDFIEITAIGFEGNINFERIEDTNILVIKSIPLKYVLFGNVKKEGDIYYSKDKTALIKYSCEESTFDIPDNIVEIGSAAFENCDSLTSIIIPDSVLVIGEKAFYNCENLESVYISNSATIIDFETFYGCKKLKSITIPRSVKHIGKSAFSGCDVLESIIIPESLDSVTGSIFSRSLETEIFATIYLEIKEKPEGWNYNWNSQNFPIVWSSVFSDDDNPYVVSIDLEKIEDEVYKNNGIKSVLYNPYREGYILEGWYSSPDFTGESVASINDAYQNNNSGIFYVKWIKNS